MKALTYVLFTLVFATSMARADTLQDFAYEGTFDMGTVTGSLTINTTTGVVLGGSFDIMAPGGAARSVLGPIDTNVYMGDTDIDLVVIHVDPNGYLSTSLNVPVPSLIGYAGGLLCTYATPCSGDLSGVIYEDHGHDFLTGSITPVATTPEPSPLALLGTGALGLFGVVRRRFSA